MRKLKWLYPGMFIKRWIFLTTLGIILVAMGFAHEVAHGSPRLSLGKDNSDQDIDHVLEILPGIIEKLRKMSPLYSG